MQPWDLGAPAWGQVPSMEMRGKGGFPGALGSLYYTEDVIFVCQLKITAGRGTWGRSSLVLSLRNYRLRQLVGGKEGRSSGVAPWQSQQSLARGWETRMVGSGSAQAETFVAGPAMTKESISCSFS